MKKLILTLIASLCLFGCNTTGNDDNPKPTSARILNPSFEEGAANIDDPQPANWVFYMPNNSQGRRAGIGFMPTHGQYYMYFWAYNSGTKYQSSGLYQDNVNLAGAKTMVFDYWLEGKGDPCILFTANGTDTLWSKKGTGSKIEKKGERISLPALPDKGRLTIMFLPDPTPTGEQLYFNLDNFKIEE